MNAHPHKPALTGRKTRTVVISVLSLLLLSVPPALGAGDGTEGTPVNDTNGGEESRQPPSQATTEPDPTEPNSTEPNPTTPGSLTLPGGEVTLEYPGGLALAVTPEQLDALSMIPACSQPFDHCFYLPESASAGTNLSAAGLRVSRRPDLTAEISCLLAQPGGWQELQPGVLRLPAASTSRFGDLSEGAAGSYSQGEVRRLWTGENCYEFEVRQVLTRYENYEPGSIQEFTVQQQAALNEELLSIVESASVNEAEVEWPLAKRSSLRAFVRLNRPALDESPRSPMTISGTAVGPWFFEGSFPVELIAEDGRVLASHYVMAEGDWMTTGFVEFSGELEFEVTEPTQAVLVLHRDNASGLPEHDAAVRLPLTLLPD